MWFVVAALKGGNLYTMVSQNLSNLTNKQVLNVEVLNFFWFDDEAIAMVECVRSTNLKFVMGGKSLISY